MARFGRKRLSVDIPNYLHQHLDQAARIRNCTITKLTIRALIQYLKKSTPDIPMLIQERPEALESIILDCDE